MKLQTVDLEICSILILKKGLGVVSPPHFPYDFQEKYFSSYILLTTQIFLSDCLYFIEIFRKTCAAIFRYQFCDVINFEIYLSFLTKPFSSMNKSSEQKTEISQEGKKLFRWNKNHFSSFLKEVQAWECTFKMTESVVAATT